MSTQVLIKIQLLFTLFAIVVQSTSVYGQACQCPKVECGPCEVQAGLEFYAEPCSGSAGLEGRIRSCSKPRCRKVARAIPQCQPQDNNSQSTQQVAEQPAAALEKVQIVIADVADVRGGLTVHRETENGTKAIGNVQKGFKLSPKDVLQTFEDSKAKILFKNGNIMVVGAMSRVEMTDYRHDAKTKEGSTLLNLVYGRIRNSISHNNKYDQEQNTFEVKTKSAVAGVRGTDFETEYDDARGDKTTIRTLFGMVALKSGITGEEHPVTKGYKMSVQSEGSGAGRSAFFSMPQEMTDVEVEEVKSMTVFEDTNSLLTKQAPATSEKVARSPANVAIICHNPSADFNQCEFNCRGAHKSAKAKSCPTETTGVQCVRRRCAANGHWVEETVLPSRFSSQCPVRGSRVDSCDY